MRVYGPRDVDALRKRILDADRVTGFNIWGFDFPVIWGYPKNVWSGTYTAMVCEGLTPSDLEDDVGEQFGVAALQELQESLSSKSDDILRRIWLAKDLDPDAFNWQTHGGWSLDMVAASTLGVKKIGHGADAPKWYQEGKIQEVVNYCADDVAIERDLCEFIDRYGYVLNAKKGEKLALKRWSD
jgi:hypothetical protein